MMNPKKQLQNVQLYPTDTFKIAISNLARKAFEMCIDGKSEIEFELFESRTKKIKSKVRISNLNPLKIRFGEFEWAVFDACVSERIEGNEYTTVAIIARHLGCNNHNSDKQSHALTQAIIDSLEKLACIRIIAEPDTDIKKIYDSPLKSGSFKFRGYLLANESLEMSVNGQEATIVHFPKNGVVLVTAEMKDQIISCPQELLESPVRSTPCTIAINHFLLRRILEIKGSAETSKSNKRVKSLRHTILLESLYNACLDENPSKLQKQHARQTSKTILDYFVEKNLINGYEFESGKNGKVRAINLDF